jgi:thiamine-phosphate pyrophosphorylase
MNKDFLRLYAVSDWRWLNGMTIEEIVEEAIEGGITMLQLRDKNSTEDEIISDAEKLLPICKAAGIPLIINDYPEIAKKCGADGVHLGLSDGSIENARKLLGDDAIIGATAHNLEEAKRAEEAGADYLGVGAAFGSSTKKNASNFNIEDYLEITSNVSIPVVAIGGINSDNISKLNGFGLAGVAVVSAIFDSDDVKKSAEKMRRLAEKLV